MPNWRTQSTLLHLLYYFPSYYLTFIGRDSCFYSRSSLRGGGTGTGRQSVDVDRRRLLPGVLLLPVAQLRRRALYGRGQCRWGLPVRSRFGVPQAAGRLLLKRRRREALRFEWWSQLSNRTPPLSAHRS